MKCASPSPPPATAATTASDVNNNNNNSNNNSPASAAGKRRSSASTKMLGGIDRAESNSSLSRTGISAYTNQQPMTPSQLMQPLLDDSQSFSDIPSTPPMIATPLNIQRYTKASRIKPHIEQTDLQNLEHRRKLPRPLPTTKCPLLCVFYAEFDIVIGPTVCFQTPHKFMHFDVNVGFEQVHQALEETFHSVINSLADEEKETVIKSDDYWDRSPSKRRESSKDSKDLDDKNTGHSLNDDGSNHVQVKSSDELKTNDASQLSLNDVTTNNITTNKTISSAHHRTPSYASSKGASTIDTDLQQNSIFAATSEYIITGNELANQTITVSTHGMHILSRPMILCDSTRYERNSHLFAVGFVLRRNIDPRPYWPVLSNLSLTMRDMEIESEFLSNARTRPQIQFLLEDVLLSLNSKQRDCHLLLDDANLLNLRLFRPPPPPTPPVFDHTVPILLRPEWQLQMFDWDLTINWIIPHIDGCKYVKQIAQSSEVDLELVRACLRVLRHHGVIALVDVFRYSNVYESTLLGKDLLKTKEGKKLLREAYFYSAKANNVQNSQKLRGRQAGDLSPNVLSMSPFAWRPHHHASSISSSVDLSFNLNGGSSSLGWSSALIGGPRRLDETSVSSFPSRTGNLTIAEKDENGEERLPPNNLSTSATSNSVKLPNKEALREEELMKNALAQIYTSCDRSLSLGKILVEKVSTVTSSKKASSSIKNENGALSTRMEIDWKTVLDHFDHRRLITFGIVRGIIRRVHQFPLAYEIGGGKQDYTETDNGDPVDDQSNIVSSDSFGASLNLSMSDISVVAAKAAAAAQNALDDCSRSHHSYPTTSPSLQGMSARKKKATKKAPTSETIALAMNGIRCDDELSCMFDTPVEKLVEAVEMTGRWNVISVFSCAN